MHYYSNLHSTSIGNSTDSSVVKLAKKLVAVQEYTSVSPSTSPLIVKFLVTTNVSSSKTVSVSMSMDTLSEEVMLTPFFIQYMKGAGNPVLTQVMVVLSPAVPLSATTISLTTALTIIQKHYNYTNIFGVCIV